MLWILTGLILTSILMGSITNALTTITFATSSIKLYGTKVGTLFTTCTIYNMYIRYNMGAIQHGRSDSSNPKDIK